MKLVLLLAVALIAVPAALPTASAICAAVYPPESVTVSLDPIGVDINGGGAEVNLVGPCGGP